MEVRCRRTGRFSDFLKNANRYEPCKEIRTRVDVHAWRRSCGRGDGRTECKQFLRFSINGQKKIGLLIFLKTCSEPSSVESAGFFRSCLMTIVPCVCVCVSRRHDYITTHWTRVHDAYGCFSISVGVCTRTYCNDFKTVRLRHYARHCTMCDETIGIIFLTIKRVQRSREPDTTVDISIFIVFLNF